MRWVCSCRTGQAQYARVPFVSDLPTRSTPKASSAEARKRMQATKGRDTKPELVIRSKLHRMGFRFRVDLPLIPGSRKRADIVFPSARVAVFIDGCFWHGCPLHRSWPKQNGEFWRTKIEANIRRDMDSNAALTELGWQVIRIWEHERLDAAIERIIEAVRPTIR